MADLITAAEFKTYYSIEHTDDDTLIAALIGYVTAAIEKYTGHSFTEETQTEYIDGGVKELIVSKRPIASITSITDTGDDSVVDSDDYDHDPEAGLIYLTDTLLSADCLAGIWGAGRRRWEVIYEGGSDGAPNDVKQAALLLVAARYNRRDSLKAEKLGDYSYTAELGWATEIKELLMPYAEIAL